MNRFLRVLLISQSANLLADHLLIPIYAIFVTQIGGSPQLAGVLWGTQAFSSALFGLFVLRIRDKATLDYHLLQANYLIKMLAWTLLAVMQTLPVMFLVQVLIGLASAVGGPSFSALISEHLDRFHHIRDWGMLELTTNIVVALAAVMSGFIAAISFTYLFIVMGLLELVSFVILRRLKSA